MRRGTVEAIVNGRRVPVFARIVDRRGRVRLRRARASDFGRGWSTAGAVVRNPWVTLKNKRRVELDQGGRIVAGGPLAFRGVHVRDLHTFGRAWRPLASADCEKMVPRERRPRYRSKIEAFDAIMYGNQNLYDFLEMPWQEGHNLDSYEAYRGRKFKDWRAALDDAIPPRGPWDAIWESARFAAFREAIENNADWPGGEIVPPAEVLVAGGRRDALAACELDLDAQITNLIKRAMSGRLDESGAGELELEDAPF